MLLHTLFTDFHASVRRSIISTTVTTTTATERTIIDVLHERPANRGPANTARTVATPEPNRQESKDPDAMEICEPSSPDPPASLTDTKAMERFRRYMAVKRVVYDTKAAILARIAAEQEAADAQEAAEASACSQGAIAVASEAGPNTIVNAVPAPRSAADAGFGLAAGSVAPAHGQLAGSAGIFVGGSASRRVAPLHTATAGPSQPPPYSQVATAMPLSQPLRGDPAFRRRPRIVDGVIYIDITDTEEDDDETDD